MDKLRIGGSFTLEPLLTTDNYFVESLVDTLDDYIFMMSGRCAINLAVQDCRHRQKKAYLPAYTCETVTASFEAGGYTIEYYDIDPVGMVPVYDPTVLERVSVFLPCGYYGFPTFDQNFINLARHKGVTVIFDATHTVFTQGGIPDNIHYSANSFRKWFGVPCGGLAIKRDGNFIIHPTETHATHLAYRYNWLDHDKDLSHEEVGGIFWKGEMLLRKIFNIQGSDDRSEDIINRYPMDLMKTARQKNYNYLRKHFPQVPNITPVFDICPSSVTPLNFVVYAKNRDQVQQQLRELGISTSVYWPVLPDLKVMQYPGAKQIYDQVLSIPCDQRFNTNDMAFIIECLKKIV